MNNKIKIVLIAVVALIIGIVIGAMFAPQGSNLGSIRFVQDKFVAGLTAGQYDEFSISSAGAVTTSGNMSVTGDVAVVGGTVVDEFTQGGGIITIATTSATYTMTAAELAGGNVISISSVTGAAALTLTLPATSTLTTVIPNTGDSRDWWIKNAHTAAATTTTIAVGTGIELQGVGTGSDVINGGVWGSLSCYREASTDIVCAIEEFVAAD